MQNLTIALLVAVILGLSAMVIIGLIRAIDSKFFKDKISEFMSNMFNENE